MLLTEIAETDQDLSGTGIQRPLQTSSSNPLPDQPSTSTSDLPDPDAEELMEITPAPAPVTMAEQLSS